MDGSCVNSEIAPRECHHAREPSIANCIWLFNGTLGLHGTWDEHTHRVLGTGVRVRAKRFSWHTVPVSQKSSAAQRQIHGFVQPHDDTAQTMPTAAVFLVCARWRRWRWNARVRSLVRDAPRLTLTERQHVGLASTKGADYLKVFRVCVYRAQRPMINQAKRELKINVGIIRIFALVCIGTNDPSINQAKREYGINVGKIWYFKLVCVTPTTHRSTKQSESTK